MTAVSPQMRQFAVVLDRLASHPSDQIEYLSTLGVAESADELGLEFDDFRLPVVHELETISPKCAEKCRELDQLLSGEEVGWTFAELDTVPWQRIRATAAAAAAALALDVGGAS